MAITFVGVGAQVAGNTATPITPALPSGWQQDDLAVLVIVGRPDNDSTTEPGPASGWTKQAFRWFDWGGTTIDVAVVVWTRVLQSGDTDPSITLSGGWAAGGSSVGAAAIAAYRGVDTTTPMDATPVTDESGSQSSSWTPPSITTATANAWVLSIVGTGDNSELALLTANGFTARMSGANYDSTVGADVSAGLADYEKSSAGAVTMLEWEQTVNDPDFWVGATLALKPAAGAATVTGDAALSGAGSLTVSGTVTRFGSAALSGTGSLTASASGTVTGDAALSGAGTLAVSGTVTRFGSITSTGSGQLTASAFKSTFGDAALTGTGAVTVAGVATISGSAALSGTGTLSADADPAVNGSAALSGTGTLSASATLGAFGSASLSGTGSLQATGGRTAFATANLSGTGTLVVNTGLPLFLNILDHLHLAGWTSLREFHDSVNVDGGDEWWNYYDSQVAGTKAEKHLGDKMLEYWRAQPPA